MPPDSRGRPGLTPLISVTQVLLFSYAGLASTSPVAPLLLMFGCRLLLVVIAGEDYIILVSRRQLPGPPMP